MAESNLKLNITGDSSKLKNALSSASSRLQSFGSKMQNVGKQMSVSLTLPIVAAGGAAIKFASDFQESMNKVDVAFGNSRNEVKEFAKTTLKEFGIAEGSALDMAALFGDMATSMGLSTTAAAGMSTQLVGLAGDLASFKNINIQEAQTALAGVFTGETESLKRLGVVMTEVNLKNFAMERGMNANLKTMSQAEKVALRYEFIMAKTSNAQGDFSRTSGGAANQMRIFQESLKELAARFGEIILPVFTKLVTFINGLIQKFGELSPTTKKVILIFAGVVAALGPIIAIIGTLMTLAPAIGAALTVMTGPIGLVVAALTAVGVVIYKNWSGIKAALIKIANYFIELYNKALPIQLAVDFIIMQLKNFLAVGKFVFKALVTLVTLTAKNIVTALKAVGDIILGIFTLDPDRVKKGFSEALSGVKNNVLDAFDDIKTEAGNLGSSVVDNFNEALERKQIAKITVPVEVGETGEGETDVNTTTTNNQTSIVDPSTVDKIKKLNDEINKALITTDRQSYIQRKAEAEKYYNDLISQVESGSETEKQLIQAKNNTLAQIESDEQNRLLEIKQQFADVTNASEDEQKALQIERIKQQFAELRQLAIDNNLMTAEQQKAFDTAQAEAEAAVYEEKKVRFLGFMMSQQEALDLMQNIGGQIDQSFGAIGNSITKMFGGAESASGAFVGTLARDAMKIIGHNLRVSMANSIDGATMTAKSFGPAAAFVLPALIAGATALISSSFAKFAKGGIVSGPTMGLVGEYPGARQNPEVIAPLNKLQSMIGGAGGGNVNVTGNVRIDGQDLLIAIERANETSDRIY